MAAEAQDEEQIEDEPIAWGTAATNGLSRRMALRVATRFKKAKGGKFFNGKKRTPKEVIEVGLGVYDFNRPEWYPDLKDAPDYSDEWDDWTDAEVATLKKRLKDGTDAEMLYWVFQVPKLLRATLDADIAGQPLSDDEKAALAPAPRPAGRPPDSTESVVPLEDAEYDLGVFTEIDTPDVNIRRYSNRRYGEYGASVDLDKPANQMTIKMMIVYEVQFMLVQRRLNGTDKRTRKGALTEAKQIQDGFSKCAGDVALLQKQYKLEPESESLDSIILRTHDIRKNWRSMEIQNEMGLRNLFDLLEQAHKTDRDEDGNKPEIEIPEVKIGKSDGKQYNHQAILIEQSDKGVDIVVDG